MDLINKLINNNYVASILILFVTLYASYVAPTLPPKILNLFNTNLSKLILCFLIAYTASRNIRLSLVISIVFIITVHYANIKMASIEISKTITTKSQKIVDDLKDDGDDEDDEDDDDDEDKDDIPKNEKMSITQ